MGKVDQFLDMLVNYKKEEIQPEIIKAIQPYLKDKEFKPDLIRSKSAAAAGIHCQKLLYLPLAFICIYLVSLSFNISSDNLYTLAKWSRRRKKLSTQKVSPF